MDDTLSKPAPNKNMSFLDTPQEPRPLCRPPTHLHARLPARPPPHTYNILTARSLFSLPPPDAYHNYTATIKFTKRN